MGYTHYWTLNAQINEAVINDVKKALVKYADLIRYESEDAKPPLVDTANGVRFNGIEEDGHETFWVRSGDREFCKTAEKPYDLPVCETLLLFKHHYGEAFELSSDGFWVGKTNFENKKLDAYWNEALQNVEKEFGYEFDLVGETTTSGGRAYYQFHIQSKQEQQASPADNK